MGDGWISPGGHDQKAWDDAWPGDPPGFKRVGTEEKAAGDITDDHEWLSIVTWSDVKGTRNQPSVPVREECERCGSHVHRLIDDKGAAIVTNPAAALHHVADRHFGDHTGSLWRQTLFKGREIKRTESRLAHADGTLYGFATVQWLERVVNYRADEVVWDDILSEFPCRRDGGLIVEAGPTSEDDSGAALG